MPMNPRLLRPLATGGFDADAQAYITAVQAADGQALEQGVKVAYNDFITGCKSDGIWSAIKASCILAGARTLAGALVPLVGSAPTNNNFVSGDYDRETGLVGNESTKYLDSSRNSNAEPQDDHHVAVWISENGGASGSATQKTVIGAGGTSAGAVMVNGRTLDNLAILRMRSAASITSTSGTAAPGLVGMSRSSSANYQYLTTQSASALTQSTASDGIINGNTYVFANNNSGATAHTGHRLAFYSIGESLDLAALDNRVSTLITAIGAAI